MQDHSPSFQQISDVLSRPLIQSIGPLSRLIAHTIANVKDPLLAQTAIVDLSSFSKTLQRQWRQNRISAVDQAEESLRLDQDTLTRSVPVLWRALRSAFFAIIIVLQAVMGRLLADSSLARHDGMCNAQSPAFELYALTKF